MLIVGSFEENELKELEFIYKTVTVENRIRVLAIKSRGD